METRCPTLKKQAVNICFCMQSLLVNWLFIIFLFKGKHLECSRTLSLLIGDRVFIELLSTCHISSNREDKSCNSPFVLFCFVFSETYFHFLTDLKYTGRLIAGSLSAFISKLQVSLRHPLFLILKTKDRQDKHGILMTKVRQR